MCLANAIYFNAGWSDPFDRESTCEQVFNTPQGDVEVPFMHKGGSMRYLEGNGARGVALPYDDGKFVYFALQPDAGSPREWLGSQDQDSLF